MVDLSVTPIQAISAKTQHLIENFLNPPKVIPASNGLLRDWRGFAHECKVAVESFAALGSHPNPFGDILKILQASQEFTLKDLNEILEKIERFDVIEDLAPCLCEDAEDYQKKLEKSKNSAEVNDCSRESEVLTLDDVHRINRGEKPQHYDAFLLYADRDEDFALRLIDFLENQHNFKLFIKERDLAAGLSSETVAIMRLISERCNRVIPIISPQFLESKNNQYFLNFALACGIEKDDRKIIPFVYQNCKLPMQVQFSSKIYHSENSKFTWERLAKSLKCLNPPANAQPAFSTSQVVLKKEQKPKPGVQKQDSSCDQKPSKVEKVSKRIPILQPIKKLIVKKKKQPSVTNNDSEIIRRLPTVDDLEPFESSSNTVEKKKKKRSSFFKKCELLA